MANLKINFACPYRWNVHNGSRISALLRLFERKKELSRIKEFSLYHRLVNSLFSRETSIESPRVTVTSQYFIPFLLIYVYLFIDIFIDTPFIDIILRSYQSFCKMRCQLKSATIGVAAFAAVNSKYSLIQLSLLASYR